MEPITWTNERRKLSELIPWPRNPRQIKVDKGKRLANSYRKFSQTEMILIEPDNGLLNGHQRLKVWGAEFGPDMVVEVRVASRKLTEKEKEELTILHHHGATGEWDFDTLSEWDVPDLIAWGFAPGKLGVIDTDIDLSDTPKAGSGNETGPAHQCPKCGYEW